MLWPPHLFTASNAPGNEYVCVSVICRVSSGILMTALPFIPYPGPSPLASSFMMARRHLKLLI